MSGRFLVVLRIDDRLPARKGHVEDSPALLVGSAPPGLDLHRFRVEGVELTGISDWETAILFWQNYTPSVAIDLVVADVRFDFDRTSPLVTGDSSSDIPTGLSHLKPFASMARVRGSPMGIGLHTADPFLWERLAWGDSRVGAAMGFLAAHEAGEVAAILEQAGEFPEAANEERVRWCWKWLADHAAAAFADACRVAVRDYRRGFAGAARVERAFPPRVMVMPRHWVLLAQWCEAMRQEPRPIGATGPAVEFILPDGTRDSIWLRSLFADVKVADVEGSPLPRSCYEIDATWQRPAGATKTSAADEFVDPGGMPQIGTFVRVLRGVHDVVEAAWSALSSFPVRLGTANENQKLGRNLLEVVPDDGVGRVARGLAVLLQCLRRDYENWQQWEVAIHDYAWDVRRQRLGDEPANCDALRDHLEALLGLMPRSAEFYLAEAFEDHEWAGAEIADPVPAWVRWHVNLLVDAGALSFDSATGLFRRLKRALPPLPLPSVLPEGDMFVGRDIATYLMQTLGFSAAYGPGGSDNWRGTTRAVRSAFGLDSDAAGGEFVEAFVRGSGPRWLKEICGEVLATKMKWTDTGSWPRAVREG